MNTNPPVALIEETLKREREFKRRESRPMKKIVLPLAILVAAAGLAGAMVLNKREPEKKAIPDSTVLADTVPIAARTVEFTVTSQGTVGPRTETTLVSEISGVVLAVSPKFVAGGFFDQGEVLLTIDPADYEVAVEQARANLVTMRSRLTLEVARAEQAEKEWELSGRSRDQAPQLALRTPYMEEARANVLFAEADLKKAERKLEHTRIRAPYQGMIKAKAVDVGQYVGIGTQLGQTVAVDFAEVRLPLTDADIAYLDLPRPSITADPGAIAGPPVELSAVIGGRSHRRQATIVRTEGVIDERSRVHYAVARITDPYGLTVASALPPLAIGSFVTAAIRGVTQADVMPVPRHAVRGDDTVLVMDNENRLRIKPVAIVRADDEFAYVTSGLTAADRVIVSAIEVPVEGMPLRAVER